MRYDNNGDAVFTVNSQKGDKVFAPGTEQSYTFTLSNTGSHSLDYILTIEAFYENTDGLWIPIEGRLHDYTGAWLVGSETQWPDVLELDGYKKEGVLACGSADAIHILLQFVHTLFGQGTILHGYGQRAVPTVDEIVIVQLFSPL